MPTEDIYRRAFDAGRKAANVAAKYGVTTHVPECFTLSEQYWWRRGFESGTESGVSL